MLITKNHIKVIKFFLPLLSVGRPEMPTFSSLNLDGCSSPTPAPPPPPPICYDNCEIPRQHCYDCGKCVVLCYDHFGCDCEPPSFDPTEIECAICYCTREVKLMWHVSFVIIISRIIQCSMFCRWKMSHISVIKNLQKKRTRNRTSARYKLCWRGILFRTMEKTMYNWSSASLQE